MFFSFALFLLFVFIYPGFFILSYFMIIFWCLLVSLEEREKERVWIWMEGEVGRGNYGQNILYEKCIFIKRKKKEIKNSLACALSSTAFLAAEETGTYAHVFVRPFSSSLWSSPGSAVSLTLPLSPTPSHFTLSTDHHLSPFLHPQLFPLCVSKSERSSLISSWRLNSDCSLVSPSAVPGT